MTEMQQITSEELQKLKTTRISVIGPTNEGKTSVLRTLTGDPNFGEVNPLSGTTKKALIQKVFYCGAELLQLIDTPGFQMSGAILDRLNGDNLPPEKVLAAVPEDDVNYTHDLRAWREIVKSDIVIYVANVRENPRQSLIQDSLDLLTGIRKPLLVLFNNIPDNNIPDEKLDDYRPIWIKELQRRKIENRQVYDAHHRNFNNEVELFKKLGEFIIDPIASKVLKLEMENRRNREIRRMEDSRRIICELLIATATLKAEKNNVLPEDREEKTRELSDELNRTIYEMEHQAHVELLKAWGFGSGILDSTLISVSSSTVEANDLLGKNAFERYTSGTTWGAGIGAGVGLALDIALGGLSLGTGTSIGALIGGALGGGISGFQQLHYNEAARVITATPEKEVLFLLLDRSAHLVKKLQARGKALEDGIQVLVSKTPEPVNDPVLRHLFSSFMSEQKKNGGFLQRLIGLELNENTLTDFKKQLLTRLTCLLPNP